MLCNNVRLDIILPMGFVRAMRATEFWFLTTLKLKVSEQSRGMSIQFGASWTSVFSFPCRWVFPNDAHCGVFDKLFKHAYVKVNQPIVYIF